MCDFHSILGVAVGDNYEIRHDPSNSHSEMAGTIENKPNRRPVIFEAEWDGRGELPSDSRLIRNFGECPERMVKKIRDHYIKLKEAIETGKHLDGYFADMEKWGDVWSRVKAIPALDWSKVLNLGDTLYLSSLTTLPEGVTFPKEVGTLYLRSLTTLPEGVTFPKEVGTLDLSSLTTLPEGVTFPKEVGTLYLSSLTTLPEGVTFPRGCDLYMPYELRLKTVRK